MKLYAVVTSIILVFVLVGMLKWKISTLALTWFCKEKFREPNEKEIADYTRKVISKMIKLD